jgi:hypothetical protein
MREGIVKCPRKQLQPAAVAPHTQEAGDDREPAGPATLRGERLRSAKGREKTARRAFGRKLMGPVCLFGAIDVKRDRSVIGTGGAFISADDELAMASMNRRLAGGPMASVGTKRIRRECAAGWVHDSPGQVAGAVNAR